MNKDKITDIFCDLVTQNIKNGETSTRYTGEQSQSANDHFSYLYFMQMPPEILIAVTEIKIVAATVNKKNKKLPEMIADVIINAANDLLIALIVHHFILHKKNPIITNPNIIKLYAQQHSNNLEKTAKTTAELIQSCNITAIQSGSGTSTNMQINECIAKRAQEKINNHTLIHANDHVNLGQSTNDCISTAIHLACIKEIPLLLQVLEDSINILQKLINKYGKVTRPGITHWREATPITYEQYLQSKQTIIRNIQKDLLSAANKLNTIPLGGTAVGTGINSFVGFAPQVIQILQQKNPVLKNLKTTDSKTAYAASHDRINNLSGVLANLATFLLQTSKDLKFLSCPYVESISLPSHEEGSSIMPGKTNPTQLESLEMSCIQVIGYQNTINISNLYGLLELNTAKPLIAMNIIRALQLLICGTNSLNTHCLEGLVVDVQRAHQQLQNSPMVATILTRELGYDTISRIVKKARKQKLTVREIILQEKIMSEEKFNTLTNPQNLTQPQQSSE